jgi:hypothetical protein
MPGSPDQQLARTRRERQAEEHRHTVEGDAFPQ